MNESYVECLVAKKPSGGMAALKVILIALTALGVLGGMVFFPLLVVAAAAGVGAYFASLHASMEYEYLYVDREISVDKIFNKTRRKKAEKFEVDRIEIFAPINSWHMDSYKNRQFKTTDYSSGVAGQPDKRYVMIYNGDRKVIFEPSAALVKAVQSVAPRKVFLD
ncbi:MAG: DUF6106 family protein [Eubacteriales bacterium]|nr:DUF6106 family protein [Eubacteriales bacterium]